MQRLADGYVRAATVLFVCAAALLCARVAAQLAASYMWTPRALHQPGEAKPLPPVRPESEADYLIISTRNLFNDNPPPPGAPAGDRPPLAAPEAPPLTVDFGLVATAVQAGGKSFAVFTRGDATLIRRPGMEVSPGITLSEVHRENVVVLLGKEKREIPLFTDGPAEAGRRPSARASAPVAPPPPSASSNENIKQIGSNSWAIDRKEVDGALANLSSLITQLRVVPNLVDGQTQGFKVFNIRPGSVFSQIGLLDGDVIREVNGQQLTGIDVAYQAMSSISGMTSLQVKIDRANQSMTLSYEIR